MHLRSDLVRFVSVLGLLGRLAIAAITGCSAVADSTDTAVRHLPDRAAGDHEVQFRMPYRRSSSSAGRPHSSQAHYGKWNLIRVSTSFINRMNYRIARHLCDVIR